MDNYTRPNDGDHNDDPKEWLNSALIFARAISLILDDHTGIIVRLTGEMYNPIGDTKQVIVFKKNGQIFIRINYLTECAFR